MKYLKDHLGSMFAFIAIMISAIYSSHKGDVADTVFFMGLLNVMTLAILLPRKM